ncbi:MAG: hypothetical protein HY842_00535 [Bacteroidetes bacterium]|nr:hypothetical protein [Bacteroidota bacterium]
MVIINKVNRQDYRQKGDSPLKSFASTVVEKGKGNPDYTGQSAQVLAVEAKSLLYNESLSLAETYGGTDRTTDKDKCRKDLLDVLDLLVEALEAVMGSKPDPAAFIQFLGFVLAKIPSRKTGVVAFPVIKTMKSGGDDPRRGVVKCVLKADDPLEINAIVGQRSDDNGETWTNGLMSTKLAFEMTGQPSGVNALYQFKFIATNNRESDWCPPKAVPVV